MQVLSAELVQRLARWRGGEHRVVSLYLNVDGRSNIRSEDYRQHLEALIKEVDVSEYPNAVSDLERMKHFVENEFDRGNNRGLAVFASGDALWEVIGLPVPVEDRLIINSTPHVRELEVVLDENRPVGVLLTDRQRARLFVIELNQIVERAEVVNPLPRHDDDKGDWRKDHVKTHASVSAQHHLRDAAQEMFEVYKRRSFPRLVLGVTEELKSDLERQLHAYLRTKVIGRCSLGVNANDDEIIRTAHELSQQSERAEEQQFVEKLRAGVPAPSLNGSAAAPSTAVAGLDPTLDAIFDRRVDTLLVSEGYAAEGWRCHECQYIATRGRRCRICGAEMSLVSDVVEEAVEDALAQKCRVEFCSGNADLDVMGQIGALLRF